MIEYIVFDLWETLLHMPTRWLGLTLLKHEFFIPPEIWKEKVKPLYLCRKYKDEEAFLKTFSEELGVRFDIREYATKIRRQLDIDRRAVSPFLDAIQVLDTIKRLGMLKTGIISNHTQFYNLPYTQSVFPSLIDTAIFSYEVGYRKPEYEIYYHFLDIVNVTPSKVIMVGDNRLHDCETPRRLGMHGYHINRGGTSPISLSTLTDLLGFVNKLNMEDIL